MRELIIDDIRIHDDAECYVIAEIGHNHRGELETCKEMFRVAKECGATAVKLQKRDNQSLFTEAMYNKPYDNENSYGATYGEHREFLEFDRDEYQALINYAKELGITFFSTAFDFKSADFLADLGLPAFKMASGDLTNIALLKYVAQYGKPMIISTGGANMEDVERAYEAVLPINPNFAILQCTSGYPAPFEELDLKVIETFRERFPNTVIGLSAHDNSISMPLVAYVLGARIIEKHFTLNHTWKGTDHPFSLEPIGFRKMVRDLQRARIAFGDGVKKQYASEVAPIRKMAKSLYARYDLAVGTQLRPGDIALKSPAEGIPAHELDQVVGQTLTRDLQQDDLLSYDDLSG